MTGAELTYDIINILTHFGYNGDIRIDPEWLNNKRDQTRAYLITQEFKRVGFVNPSWYQDLNLLQFTPIVASDIDYGICGSCPVSKTNLPPTISLFNPDNQNEDNGFKLISPCGTTQYFYYPLDVLKQIPSEHPRLKFAYYWEIGTYLYVNKKVDKLRSIAILQRPSDANNISNLIVASGSLVVGTVYKVVNFQIVHNGLGYNVGQTFTAVNANYTGQGAVVLANPVLAFDENTTNYPVDGEMARLITLEILTKEFGLEKQQISSYKNDLGDDATQITQRAAQV